MVGTVSWYSGTILWYRWRLLAPLAEEGLEAGLGELDDLHVPGLRRLHAAHVLLLLAAEARAVEEVARGTPVQQGLHGKILIICYKQGFYMYMYKDEQSRIILKIVRVFDFSISIFG